MTENSFLKLENQEFNKIDEFTNFLIDKRDINEFGDDLKIIGAISEYRQLSELKNSLRGFKVEKQFGNLLLLVTNFEEIEREFYVYFDETNGFCMFTTLENKTDVIPKTLMSFIQNTPNFSPLWINPEMLDDIKGDICSDYQDTLIPHFVAKRRNNTEIPAKFRGDRKRVIEYYGEDGKTTLKELKGLYGVLPTVLEFKLPNNNQFVIDHKGIFTLKKGDFDIIFETISDSLKKLLEVRDVVNSSSYDLVKADTEERSFSMESKKPWIIDLEEKIKYEEVPKIEQEIEDNEWGFAVVDKVAEKGSLYLSARLIDTRKNREIEIVSDGTEIKVFPPEDEEIGSSMRFFQFVKESIDKRAEAVRNVQAG